MKPSVSGARLLRASFYTLFDHVIFFSHLFWNQSNSVSIAQTCLGINLPKALRGLITMSQIPDKTKKLTFGNCIVEDEA